MPTFTTFFLIFTRFYLFFREGKGRRKRGRETSMCGCLSHAPYTWPTTRAYALDWDLNQRPFDSQTSTQSTKPHQPGPLLPLLFKIILEVLATGIRKEKEIKRIQIAKDEAKLSLFADDMIVYM